LNTPLTEAQIEHICRSLMTLENHKLLLDYAIAGRRRYPNNAYFPFYEAEAYILQGPYRGNPLRVRDLLTQARELSQALPPDARREALLEMIKARELMVTAANPFGGMDFD